MLNLDNHLLDAPCPRCGYALEVALIDVRVERRIFCPNCKARIDLHDEGASTEVSVLEIDQAMDDIAKTLRSIGG